MVPPITIALAINVPGHFCSLWFLDSCFTDIHPECNNFSMLFFAMTLSMDYGLVFTFILNVHCNFQGMKHKYLYVV